MSRSLRTRSAIALSTVLVVIGVALLVETALVRGEMGYLLGALFVLAGVLRLYLSR